MAPRPPPIVTLLQKTDRLNRGSVVLCPPDAREFGLDLHQWAHWSISCSHIFDAEITSFF